MIKLQETIRNELAGRFGVEGEQLQYLAGGREDSDGIVYTYNRNNTKYVMKITAMDDQRSVERLAKKLDFSTYLGEHGVCVASAERSSDGQIFQMMTEGKYTIIASTMRFIDGICPKMEELDDKILFEWGKLTGRMHFLNKKYCIWKNFEDNKEQSGHEEEIDMFHNWCRNEVVKKHWIQMKKELSDWEISRDCYGMIHNDNHQNNIIVGTHGITLLDFDVANCHFILNDILTPVQGLLFDLAGGFTRPISDKDSIKRFYESFLSGYETESHIEDCELKKMTTLLSYRRLLLYTVMQDWMESDRKVGESFLNMIENPCELEIA